MANPSNKCEITNCLWICDIGAPWNLRKCSSCFTKSVYVECCQELPDRYPGGNYVFCSTQCFDRGPILLMDLGALKTYCKELSKNVLKAVLRSIPLSVYCPERDSMDASSRRVELKKKDMIMVLLKHRIQMAQPEGAIGITPFAKKTASCVFRLVNVLFSDHCYSGFCHLGDKHTRQELDTGGKKAFWNAVADQYVSDFNEYSILHFNHACFNDIDPSYVIPHPAEKLMNMWKEVHCKYRVAHANYRKSGNHNPEFLAAVQRSEEMDDFQDFASYRPILMYVRQWLQQKPLAAAYVEATLPNDCQFDSMDIPTISDEVHDDIISAMSTDETRTTTAKSLKTTEKQTRASKRKSDLVNSLEALSNAGAIRAEKRYAIAKECNIYEAEKVALLKTKTAAQVEVFRVQVKSQSNQETERRCQARVDALQCLLDHPGLLEEDRQHYLLKLKRVHELLLEALDA